MPRSLQDKLLEAQESDKGCVLVLTDGSEVACKRIKMAGSTVAGEGNEITVELADIENPDETTETFEMDEIEDVRLGKAPPE